MNRNAYRQLRRYKKKKQTSAETHIKTVSNIKRTRDKHKAEVEA